MQQKRGALKGAIMQKKRRRILLADDDDTTSQLLKSILQLAKYEVDVVADGCHLLQVVAATPYDLIIIDIKSPEVDCVCVSHFIRLNEQPLGRRTPIMALTAHSFEECREIYPTGGIDAYLVKPLELKQLLLVIENLVTQDPAQAKASEAGTLGAKPAAIAADASCRMCCKTGIC